MKNDGPIIEAAPPTVSAARVTRRPKKSYCAPKSKGAFEAMLAVSPASGIPTGDQNGGALHGAGGTGGPFYMYVVAGFADCDETPAMIRPTTKEPQLRVKSSRIAKLLLSFRRVLSVSGDGNTLRFIQHGQW
jgi:hypothetical protein